MCRCRDLRRRVDWLEAALAEAEWDLRYRAVIEETDRDDPNRRIQLRVASDLARARVGLLSERRAVLAVTTPHMGGSDVEQSRDTFHGPV